MPYIRKLCKKVLPRAISKKQIDQGKSLNTQNTQKVGKKKTKPKTSRGNDIHLKSHVYFYLGRADSYSGFFCLNLKLPLVAEGLP